MKHLWMLIVIGPILWGCEAWDDLKNQVEDTLVSFVPTEVDERLGNAGFASIGQQTPIVQDPAVKAAIAKLAHPLIAQAQRRLAVPYQIHVTDDPTINAYALPGGHVLLPKGLITFASTPAEVAGVLAHELAHISERHSTQRLLTTMGLSLIFQVFVEDMSGLLQILVTKGADLLILKYSRDHEREADRVGCGFLQAAGMDASGLATFFQRLSQQNDEKSELPHSLDKIMSTHPVTTERIETLQKLAGNRTADSNTLLTAAEFKTLQNRLRPSK